MQFAVWAFPLVAAVASRVRLRAAHHAFARTTVDTKASWLHWIQFTFGTHLGILVVTGASRKVGMFRRSRAVAALLVSEFDTLGTMQADVLIMGTKLNPMLAMKAHKSFLTDAVLKVLIVRLIQLSNMWSNVRNHTKILGSLATLSKILAFDGANIQVVQMCSFVMDGWCRSRMVGMMRRYGTVVFYRWLGVWWRWWQVLELTAWTVKVTDAIATIKVIVAACPTVGTEELSILVAIFITVRSRLVLTETTGIGRRSRVSAGAIAVVLLDTICE